MQDDRVPSWWRSFWGAPAAAAVTLLVLDNDYGLLAPSVAGLGIACFGFEYLARQGGNQPSD
jgi:hypothetical protein